MSLENVEFPKRGSASQNNTFANTPLAIRRYLLQNARHRRVPYHVLHLDGQALLAQRPVGRGHPHRRTGTARRMHGGRFLPDEGRFRPEPSACAGTTDGPRARRAGQRRRTRPGVRQRPVGHDRDTRSIRCVLATGDFGKAAKLATAGLAEAEQSGLRAWTPLGHFVLAQAALRQGHLSTALRYTQKLKEDTVFQREMSTSARRPGSSSKSSRPRRAGVMPCRCAPSCSPRTRPCASSR